MLILGIETSCDETALAVVKDGRKIVSSTLSSSLALHKTTGGVIPEQAAREQIKYIIPVLQKTLIKAFPGKKLPEIIRKIDALAVTIGPGLIGSLLVGVETAKTLARLWEKPLVPVNHLVAHLYANWLETNVPYIKNDSEIFPALCLIVSGGHTDLALLKKHGEFIYLGGTRDDAAGEAFDKTARLLELTGFMGGPVIANVAEKHLSDPHKYPGERLPRPMIDSNDFDFSFSGLKTAVLNQVTKIRKENPDHLLPENIRNFLACETQESITDVLRKKITKAIEKFQPKSVLLAGGVSANLVLRKKIKLVCQKYNLNFFVPPINLCTDNAAYIAGCAFFNYRPADIESISANPSLELKDFRAT